MNFLQALCMNPMLKIWHFGGPDIGCPCVLDAFKCYLPSYVGAFKRTAIWINLTQQIAGGVIFDIEVILPESQWFTSRSALTLQLYCYRGSSVHPSLDTWISWIHSCIALQKRKDLMKQTKRVFSILLIYCSPSSGTWKMGLCAKSLAMSTRYPI